MDPCPDSAPHSSLHARHTRQLILVPSGRMPLPHLTPLATPPTPEPQPQPPPPTKLGSHHAPQPAEQSGGPEVLVPASDNTFLLHRHAHRPSAEPNVAEIRAWPTHQPRAPKPRKSSPPSPPRLPTKTPYRLVHPHQAHRPHPLRQLRRSPSTTRASKIDTIRVLKNGIAIEVPSRSPAEPGRPTPPRPPQPLQSALHLRPRPPPLPGQRHLHLLRRKLPPPRPTQPPHNRQYPATPKQASVASKTTVTDTKRPRRMQRGRRMDRLPNPRLLRSLPPHLLPPSPVVQRPRRLRPGRRPERHPHPPLLRRRHADSQSLQEQILPVEMNFQPGTINRSLGYFRVGIWLLLGALFSLAPPRRHPQLPPPPRHPRPARRDPQDHPRHLRRSRLHAPRPASRGAPQPRHPRRQRPRHQPRLRRTRHPRRSRHGHPQAPHRLRPPPRRRPQPSPPPHRRRARPAHPHRRHRSQPQHRLRRAQKRPVPRAGLGLHPAVLEAADKILGNPSEEDKSTFETVLVQRWQSISRQYGFTPEAWMDRHPAQPHRHDHVLPEGRNPLPQGNCQHSIPQTRPRQAGRHHPVDQGRRNRARRPPDHRARTHPRVPVPRPLGRSSSHPRTRAAILRRRYPTSLHPSTGSRP